METEGHTGDPLYYAYNNFDPHLGHAAHDIYATEGHMGDPLFYAYN